MKKVPFPFEELGPEELEEAERLLIETSQTDAFSEEKRHLGSGQPVSKSSRLYNLFPIMQNDILLIKGRLSKVPSEIPLQIRNQIILDSNHRFTRLLILHFHDNAGPWVCFGSSKKITLDICFKCAYPQRRFQFSLQLHGD